MRRYFAAILFLLMSASLALSIQKPDEWIKYTSPEGRYSVSLPAQPTLSTQEAAAADGQKFPQYLASVVGADDVVLMVAYFDMLPDTTFSTDAARDGMLKQSNGTLISDIAISLGGYSGREFKISTKVASGKPPDEGKPAEELEFIVRARVCLVDKRVYLLQVIVSKSLENEALAAKATKYFDSFQVVKN
jgi:hypothetical protein